MTLAPSDQAKVSVLLAASAEAAAKMQMSFSPHLETINRSWICKISRSLAEWECQGKLFAETSTVLPETAEKLARKVQEAGGMYVAMPIFGPMGTVVVVPAGVASGVARLKPYTDGVISRMTIDLSNEPVGKAELLKIGGNTYILSMYGEPSSRFGSRKLKFNTPRIAINLAAASGAPGILKVTQTMVAHIKKVPEVSGRKAEEAGLEFDNGSFGK
ncbi:hypothetical protein EV426DRAFT_713473 [Tirmania nivea]|nr:hypothetical protein EV426DRAFT_713473 [Tirmania nivea]